MRNRRDVIALIVLLVSLGGVAIIVQPYAEETNAADQRVSTFRSTSFGARALYLLMDELELPAQRQLTAWSADTTAGALVLLAPVQEPTPREVDALIEWVRVGGTLIYAVGPNDWLLRRLGLSARIIASPVSRATSYPEDHAWTAGIDSVSGFTRGFTPTSVALRSAGAAVLLRTSAGDPVAVTFPLGDGRVVAFADAVPLTNGVLRDAAGAAVLFARAAYAATRDGGMLRFDEFHQGYREGGVVRAVYAFATETRAGRALLQCAAACLALLLLAAHRHGAPLADPTHRRRSPLEHVEAVAGAYRRAGARQTTRRLLMAGLERRLGRRIQDDGGGLTPAVRRTPSGKRLQEEWSRDTEGDLVSLSAAIDDYVTEVRSWK